MSKTLQDFVDRLTEEQKQQLRIYIKSKEKCDE